jgi:hypothetical protein
MRSLIVLAAALLFLACTGAVVAATEIHEGLWEVSVEAEVGGQPISATPMVVRQCIGNQSVQDMMAQMGGAGGCNISGFQQDGAHARWNLACSGAMDVSGTGETEIAGDQFSGRMNLLIKMGGESMPMVQKFQAHRVGECQ